MSSDILYDANQLMSHVMVKHPRLLGVSATLFPQVRGEVLRLIARHFPRAKPHIVLMAMAAGHNECLYLRTNALKHGRNRFASTPRLRWVATFPSRLGW